MVYQVGKLISKYIVLFDIIYDASPMAYKLMLPPSLFGVHSVFHVSMLRSTIEIETASLIGTQCYR